MKQLKSTELGKINFPLYSINMLTSRHFMVAGGGGQLNSGVPNGFVIYELIFNGLQFETRETVRYDSGHFAIMNSATFFGEKKLFIAAGLDDFCQLYSVNWRYVEASGDTPSLESEFKVQKSDGVKTDYSTNDAFQRVVRIDRKGELMATGASNGAIRLWKFPNLTPIHSLEKEHFKEIDDLDFSSCSKWLVSTAKDGLVIIWNCSTGVISNKLVSSNSQKPNHICKKCRFGQNELSHDQDFVYLIQNPTSRNSKCPSYLQKWSSNGNLLKSIEIKECLSCLTVRNDGRFLAVGTMFTGSVMVYTSLSLNKVLHVPNSHSMFVTGLEFIPIVAGNYAFSTVSEAMIVSISVDNKIYLHQLPHRNHYNCNLFLNQSQNFRYQSTLSKRGLLKKAIKEYGTTVLVFHVGISLMSLGFFYSLIYSGVDLEDYLSKYDWFKNNKMLENKIATNAGTFFVAYAVHKVFAPVRISITVASTPFIVRFLRNKGILRKN